MIGVWTNLNPFNVGYTGADQLQNAREMYGYFDAKGWTLEAISGMLGNLNAESYLNPAQWQQGGIIEDPNPGNVEGFGLVQWTPWQKYVDSSNWFGNWRAGPNWRTDYIRQLDRIQYEVEYDVQYPNQGQWITSAQSGNLTFKQFTESTATPADLAYYFFYGYERGTWDSSRQTAAQYWYNILQIYGPLPPSGRRLPIWLLFKLKEGWC